LAGGLVFSFLNCRNHIVVVQMLGKGSRVHKLPTPSRAAAAKTAAPTRKSAAAGKATTA
jgi:hypothetical protein